MGILNVTPDSFSDGGLFVDRDSALEHARRMIADGADIVDIGGESTRPGALPVPEDVELERVIPLVEALAREGFRVCVDTSSRPSCARRWHPARHDQRRARIAGAGRDRRGRRQRAPPCA